MKRTRQRVKKMEMQGEKTRETKTQETNASCVRRMRVGKLVAAGFSAALVLGLTACGAGSSYSSESVAPQQNSASFNSGAGYAYMEEAGESYASGTNADMAGTESAAANPGQSVDNSSYYDERKLIKTVNLKVETKEFDSMLTAVEEQVKALGGYIENMNTYNGSRYSGGTSDRSSSITARIPRKQLDGFVGAVSEAGNVISRTENVQDVTLSYVDLESRRNALQAEQERLQALLEKAETLEDILIIEDRMSTVRYQLESMESQLRTYDNQVDFSTVYLDIREVKELTPIEEEEETVWERIANGFWDSLMDVKDGLVDFFVWFVVAIPYLAVWAAIIFGIVMVVKLIIRRSRRKREEKIRNLQSTQPAQGVPNMQNPRPGQSAPNVQNTQQNGQK